MASSSPYESAIAALRVKMGGSPPEASVVGPKAFVEAIIENRTEFEEHCSLRTFLRLQAGDLSLKSLDVKVAWAELYVLFIRAFQSMQSRAAMKAFMVAIDDGRFSATPLDLSRIKPEWCSEMHTLYIHCWRIISNKDGVENEKKAATEVARGRTIVNKITGMIDLSKAKYIKECLKIVTDNPECMRVAARLSSIAQEDGDILEDAYAYLAAKFGSGGINMAKLAREGMRLAQNNGIDPNEMAGMVGKYKNMVPGELMKIMAKGQS